MSASWLAAKPPSRSGARAAGSRACPPPPRGSGRRRSAPRRGRRRGRAARCRRASARSAARARPRRSRSGGSRRRAGRGSRRRPSRRGVRRAIGERRRRRPRAWRRSRSSIVIGCGNFGAPAPPAVRRVERALDRRESPRQAPPATADPRVGRTRPAGSRRAPRRAVPPAASTSARCSVQARRTPVEHLAERRHPVARRCPGSRSRRRTAGRPASGRRSSASRPGPVIAWTAPMYSWSTSGRSSRSTLIGTKWALSVRGRRLVLERLALHHVAPVAGRVADRQEDRAVAVVARAPAPPAPMGTSRPGCGRAGAGTGWSRRRGGSPACGVIGHGSMVRAGAPTAAGGGPPGAATARQPRERRGVTANERRMSAGGYRCAPARPASRRDCPGPPPGRVARRGHRPRSSPRPPVRCRPRRRAPLPAPAPPRVVIIVGPAGAPTEGFRRLADEAAAAARRTGPTSPASTPRTQRGRRSAARSGRVHRRLSRPRQRLARARTVDAPYPPNQNGFGLNPVAGVDDEAHQYFGEQHVGDVRWRPMRS